MRGLYSTISDLRFVYNASDPTALSAYISGYLERGWHGVHAL